VGDKWRTAAGSFLLSVLACTHCGILAEFGGLAGLAVANDFGVWFKQLTTCPASTGCLKHSHPGLLHYLAYEFGHTRSTVCHAAQFRLAASVISRVGLFALLPIIVMRMENGGVGLVHRKTNTASRGSTN
jgi:hypothetical protein